LKLRRGGLLMWKPRVFWKKINPADSTGLSSEEYGQIIEHVEQCNSCHSAHAGFLSFLEHLAVGESDGVKDDIRRHIEDGGLRERFVQRARAEGIPFSSAAAASRQPNTRPVLSYRWVTAAALAAVILVAVGQRIVYRPSTPSLQALIQTPEQQTLIAHSQIDRKLQAKLAELQSAADESKKEISDLQDENAGMALQISDLNKDLLGRRVENQGLQQSIVHLRDQNTQQAAQFDSNAQLLARAQAELDDARARQKALETENGAEKAEVGMLSQQLNTRSTTIAHDRELLAEGRDITDLMGARNLHIIDVRDADGKGKNQKSFGRIFYTEGKSLIFYAYDLDQGKVSNAHSSFQVWGERLGEPTSVRSLGILFTDSKDLKRWALTVDDPQQLAEIDSLFVTLEPHQGARKPIGGKILFAFLGGKANHP